MGTIGRHCEAHGAKIGVAPHASPAQLNQNAKALPVRKIALQSARESLQPLCEEPRPPHHASYMPSRHIEPQRAHSQNRALPPRALPLK
jgi:hypothetical protein